MHVTRSINIQNNITNVSFVEKVRNSVICVYSNVAFVVKLSVME